MAHLHLDPFGGLAGDMFVAAGLDAGLVERASLEALLSRLGLGAVRIVEKSVQRQGISGVQIRFEVESDEAASCSRNLSDILDLLDDSGLPSDVSTGASEMFRTLGAVEAEIHDSSLADVHFHECGSVDSILDFVSAAAIVEQSDAGWSVGPVSVGGGEVDTEHGLLPVPAPATAELLEGFRVVRRNREAELVTPTGACILRHLADTGRITAMPPGALSSTGYGAGNREVEGLANIARILVLDANSADEAGSTEHEIVCRIACDIDDMNPELFEAVGDRLLDLGALDVTRVPVHMKKGRNGLRLSVTTRPEDRERMIRLLFQETTTFGVRISHCERRTLPRDTMIVQTEYGEVEVKVGYLDGEPHTVAPEYERCRELAASESVPIRRVYDVAKAAALERLGRTGEV